MSDSYLYFILFCSVAVLMPSVIFLVVTLEAQKDSFNLIGGFVCIFVFISIPILNVRYCIDQFDKISKSRKYEIIYEIPIEVKGNVDTITYKENDYTLKILNLNSYFDRKFDEKDVILVKRGLAGEYAGWKVDRQDHFIFEIKE
jgi:hypothetical protein